MSAPWSLCIVGRWWEVLYREEMWCDVVKMAECFKICQGNGGRWLRVLKAVENIFIIRFECINNDGNSVDDQLNMLRECNE